MKLKIPFVCSASEAGLLAVASLAGSLRHTA